MARQTSPAPPAPASSRRISATASMTYLSSFAGSGTYRLSMSAAVRGRQQWEILRRSLVPRVPEAVDRINAAALAALADPEGAAKLQDLSATIVGSSPEQLAQHVQAELQEGRRLVRVFYGITTWSPLGQGDRRLRFDPAGRNANTRTPFGATSLERALLSVDSAALAAARAISSCAP